MNTNNNNTKFTEFLERAIPQLDVDRMLAEVPVNDDLPTSCILPSRFFDVANGDQWDGSERSHFPTCPRCREYTQRFAVTLFPGEDANEQRLEAEERLNDWDSIEESQKPQAEPVTITPQPLQATRTWLIWGGVAALLLVGIGVGTLYNFDNTPVTIAQAPRSQPLGPDQLTDPDGSPYEMEATRGSEDITMHADDTLPVFDMAWTRSQPMDRQIGLHVTERSAMLVANTDRSGQLPYHIRLDGNWYDRDTRYEYLVKVTADELPTRWRDDRYPGVDVLNMFTRDDLEKLQKLRKDKLRKQQECEDVFQKTLVRAFNGAEFEFEVFWFKSQRPH